MNSNFFSKEALQDEYILILTRMLLLQIKESPSINKFLSDNSVCKYLLSNLYKVNEIKNYFIQIIQPYISEIESWKTEISFEVENIIREKEKKIKSRNFYTDIPTPHQEPLSVNIVEDYEKIQNFTIENYREVPKKKTKLSISKEEFFQISLKNLNEQMLTEFLQQTIFVDTEKYIQKHIYKQNMHKDKLLFSNESFLDFLFQKDSSFNKSLDILSEDFEKCIRIVTKIFNKMSKHTELVPNSIRFILKIIAFLLKRHFKFFDNVDLYGYLSFFFVNILMESMFNINPDKNDLINPSLLTPCIQHNINLCLTIIKQFCKGEMFKSSQEQGFTLFNIFFINNYHLISTFYKSLLEQTKNSFYN